MIAVPSSPVVPAPSDRARERLLAAPFEPLLACDWLRVLFLHYEVDAAALARAVPFALDLRHGRALVSLVAFTINDFRPYHGGRLGRWLFRPIGRHHFLNVRTYVESSAGPGIYFLTEWLDNRLCVALGPRTFGLPYRRGELAYRHDHEHGVLAGRVRCPPHGGSFQYTAALPPAAIFRPCAAASDAEFLLERYTAFTARENQRRYFRVWHEPWRQCPVAVTVEEDSLLRRAWPWFAAAKFVGANYSPGVSGVWMGRPHRVTEIARPGSSLP